MLMYVIREKFPIVTSVAMWPPCPLPYGDGQTLPALPNRSARCRPVAQMPEKTLSGTAMRSGPAGNEGPSEGQGQNPVAMLDEVTVEDLFAVLAAEAAAPGGFASFDSDHGPHVRHSARTRIAATPGPGSSSLA
jgi:hypothetical protein